MVLRGSVYSNTLGMETGLTVITPNDYGQAKQYRVCYVLHGLCGGNADYSNYTMLPLYACDKDIIFICPEVQRSFYTDTKYGAAYFTYISEELPSLVRLVFNISGRREDTAVMGGSMGGYGALKCALMNPDRYGYCAAFAPSNLFMEGYLDKCRADGKTEFADFYGVFGSDFEFKKEYDILRLAADADGAPDKPTIYVCCGDRDAFAVDNRRLAEKMKNFSIEYTYEEWSGQHDLFFFDQAIKKAVDRWTCKMGDD